MGKKGTKRKTRWRALPLGEDEAGSGNEEELLDEDRSTTSSLAGQTTNIKVHPPIYKMGDRPYRPQRRFPYDKFRNKEPLIKLESKMFDEEEYTKITTPRQDVLFKKGYFGRKRESSMEEALMGTGEADSEETIMDQYIITNGFLDERGHYYVNGSSYEVYDPYSNTVTVVVGPPPYTNGINQPVLAAVSCQPVPLTPVEWYPPGEDWPTHGSAWTPSYPHGESIPSGNASPSFAAQPPSLHQQAAYIESGHPFNENRTPGYEGGSIPEASAEVLNSNDPQEQQKKTSEETAETLSNDKKEIKDVRSPKIEAMGHGDGKPAEEITTHAGNVIAEDGPASENQINEQQKEQIQEIILPPVKHVEKQNHGTQTGISTPIVAVVSPRPIKVKESHSTQTIPEDSFLVEESKQNKKVLTPTKVDQSPKCQSPKKVENSTTINNENSKIFHQRRTKEDIQHRSENTDVTPSLKVSYARKLMSGLENCGIKMGNGVKTSNMNGSQVVPAQVPESPRAHVKVNQAGKRTNMNKFSPGEGRKNATWNGNVKNGYERQRYGKGPPPRRTNNKNEISKVKKPGVRVQYEKPKEISPEQERTVVAETVTVDSRSHSEKSSTLSELSSPTELSSGQNTPPEKLIVRKMEQKIAEDLNRSFGQSLKENLTRAKDEEAKNKEVKNEEVKDVEAKDEEIKDDEAKDEEEVKDEEPNEEEAKDEEPNEEEKERSNIKPRKKKGKAKEIKAKKQKRKKKGAEEKGERSANDSPEENHFFHLYGKTQDFLSKAWESMNVEKSEPIPDFETILTTENDEILETLGIVDKWDVPKLPLASDLLTFPAFGHERPKLKFEDFFASAALKDLQNEVFTKTNITNMRSSKPEEFFATIIENPRRNRGRKENGKSGKKGVRSQEDAAVKKVKLGKGGTKKVEEKEKEIKKKEPETVKEGKLGIVDAVNSWLREQDDPEKVLSPEVLKEFSHDDDQKNELSNPIHASSAEENNGAENACIRVANESKDDGYLGTETETKKEEELTRLYRSSSWDAKLSEIQMKKHFQFLREAASWDRRKLKDVTFKKHLKFIADSANFLYREVIGDVCNGYELAREELCDPKQSVSKYYTLSPATLESDKIVECEGEAFDALDFSFGGRAGNPSITDSGVHSDSESNEETTASSDSKPPITDREASCKMQ